MGNVDTFHKLKRLVEMIGPPTLKVSTCSTLGIKLAPILATPSVVWSTSHNPWDVWNTPSIRPNKSRHGKLQPTWRQCGECDAWCCLRIKNWSSLRLNFEDQKNTPCYTGSFPSNWKVQGFCWGKVMARLHINLCEAQVSTHQMAELPLFCHRIFYAGSEVREVLNQVHGILEDEIHEIAGVCLYHILYELPPWLSLSSFSTVTWEVTWAEIKPRSISNYLMRIYRERNGSINQGFEMF